MAPDAVKRFVARSASASRRGRERIAYTDAVHRDDAFGLYIVADGLGNRNGSGAAAHIAVTALPVLLASRLGPPGTNAVASEELLTSCFGEINKGLVEAALKRPEFTGMGATVVAAWIRADRVWIAHLGDARAYLLRDDEPPQPLTRDHNLGRILQRLDADIGPLDPHGLRRLTRYLGQPREQPPEIASHVWHPGDRLLLASDGLFAGQSEAGWTDPLPRTSGKLPPEAWCVRLLEHAPDTDDVTLLAIDFD